MADIAGYLNFLRTFAQVPDDALPDNSPYIADSFQGAVDIVNLQLECISPNQYDKAVYNLATDGLINECPDTPPSTFFSDARTAYGIGGTGFQAGPVQTTGDEGTSTTLAVSDWFKNLNMADLLNLETPFGRAYMAIAGRAGSLWGLS